MYHNIHMYVGTYINHFSVPIRLQPLVTHANLCRIKMSMYLHYIIFIKYLTVIHLCFKFGQFEYNLISCSLPSGIFTIFLRHFISCWFILANIQNISQSVSQILLLVLNITHPWSVCVFALWGVTQWCVRVKVKT